MPEEKTVYNMSRQELENFTNQLLYDYEQLYQEHDRVMKLMRKEATSKHPKRETKETRKFYKKTKDANLKQAMDCQSRPPSNEE